MTRNPGSAFRREFAQHLTDPLPAVEPRDVREEEGGEGADFVDDDGVVDVVAEFLFGSCADDGG